MKKNTIKMCFLLALGFVSTLMSGQIKSNQQLTPSGHIRCYTTENEEALRAKYPDRKTTEEFETWLAPQIAKIKADRAAGRNIQAVYNIPVVIHIVHNGDCVGTGENITDAQAISQITVMNQDYRRMTATRGGANTTGLAVDSEINFILAKRDPSGNPTTGIVRHQITPYSNSVADGSGGPDWETNADVETMKTNTIWDPTKYLNMWTIRPGGLSLQNGGLDGLLGYAQFPDATGLGGLATNGGAANTDGVVAGFDAMGTDDLDDGTFILNPTYNLGRTMTHEVGHWLGLRHIWGDNSTCPATNTALNKDYCADTPAANDANYDCNLSANSCPSTPGNDQVQNYMDYTNDACMDTFTADQKARMQTIMAGAARRSTLNASNGATAPSAGIYFNKGGNNCLTVVEGTNCSYTDVNYALSVIKAPTANAVVTFNVNGASTATNNLDFQIMTPTVTFATGSTASQNLTIRYFNDGMSEASENVVIGMTVNANGGDGAIIAGADTSLLTVSILDNDVAPTTSGSTTFFSETFDPAPSLLTGIKDLNGDTYNWGVGATTNSIGFNSNFAFSRSWISPSTALSPDNILYSPATFTVPATGTSTLSFGIGTTQNAPYHQEHYSVYLTTVNPSTFTTATLNAQTPVVNNAVLAAGAQRNTINVNVSSYAGQTVYLVFRHHNTFDQNWIMLDDVTISNSFSTGVQTVVNTPTQYQAFINGIGTAYPRDTANGNVIADIATSGSAFDYGCTSVAVSRDAATAGAAAVNYGANTAANLRVMAKRITVTPATNNPSGAGTLKFYFTEAEVAAWEAITTVNRSNLRVIKGGTGTVLATVSGTFGTNFTLTGTVANGIGGDYYFGTVATLGNEDFEFASLNVYPNPNKGNFTIELQSDSSNLINVSVFDLRGRQIFDRKFANNGTFNQNINLENTQAGVYLVTITDGIKKTVKKIVIE